MSYKKENFDELLKKKYNKSVAILKTRLMGSYKAKFYNDLLRTGDSENKRMLSIMKYYYDTHPGQLKNKL